GRAFAEMAERCNDATGLSRITAAADLAVALDGETGRRYLHAFSAVKRSAHDDTLALLTEQRARAEDEADAIDVGRYLVAASEMEARAAAIASALSGFTEDEKGALEQLR